MSGEAESVLRIIAEWAAADPRIRRIWISGEGTEVVVEPQPVADSEETLPVWMANCEEWRRQLQARTGRAVRLEWRDQDARPVDD